TRPRDRLGSHRPPPRRAACGVREIPPHPLRERGLGGEWSRPTSPCPPVRPTGCFLGDVTVLEIPGDLLAGTTAGIAVAAPAGSDEADRLPSLDQDVGCLGVDLPLLAVGADDAEEPFA